jgi:hypothetical protein
MHDNDQSRRFIDRSNARRRLIIPGIADTTTALRGNAA